MESSQILRLPHKGSRWVWELEKSHARMLIEVTDVRFSGEEWWVNTVTLPDAPTPLGQGAFNDYPGYLDSPKEASNTLERFWEACAFRAVGGRMEDLSNPISKAQYRRVNIA